MTGGFSAHGRYKCRKHNSPTALTAGDGHDTSARHPADQSGNIRTQTLHGNAHYSITVADVKPAISLRLLPNYRRLETENHPNKAEEVVHNDWVMHSSLLLSHTSVLLAPPYPLPKRRAKSMDLKGAKFLFKVVTDVAERSKMEDFPVSGSDSAAIGG
jgi:hypothetical protein